MCPNNFQVDYKTEKKKRRKPGVIRVDWGSLTHYCKQTEKQDIVLSETELHFFEESAYKALHVTKLSDLIPAPTAEQTTFKFPTV